MGIIPPVKRTDSGYRIFTQIHLDYFICIRNMVKGYSLEFTGDLLKEHMKGNSDKALWMITKSQADLYNEKIRLERVGLNLIKNLNYKSDNIKNDKNNLMTIKKISKITNVSITTIRYWETIGLVSSVRGDGNNYRLFNEEQIKVILIIHALKYSLKMKYNYYNMEMLKKELKKFIYNEPNTRDLIENINIYLDKVNLEMIKAISSFYELISKDYS
jgi:DNA-binding transcriptional MerR regulator